jgi:hypothetical protein
MFLAAALLFVGLTSSSARSARADVLVVHTNDVLGEIEPCGCRSNPLGGMARKANLLKKLSEKNELIQLDAGDLLFPSDSLPPMLEKQSKLQAQYLLKSMDELHHDAVVPGEKDFALGWKVFEELRKATKIKFLAANLTRANGKQAFKPYEIFSKKDSGGKIVRVAVIGLVGETLHWPKQLKATPALAAAKKWVKRIQDAQKADVIIALTHQGLEADQALAQAVPALQIIIGGHTQSFLQDPPLVNATRIYQSSFRNQYVGVLPIAMPFSGKDYQLIGLDPAYDSPEGKPSATDTLVKEFKKSIAELNLAEAAQNDLSAEKAHAKAPRFQTWPRCAECHTEQFDFWRKTNHARALEPLVKADQSANKECLSCHTVGLGDPQGLTNIAKLAEYRDQEGVKTLAVPELNLFLKAMAEAKTLDTPVSLTPLDHPMPLQQVINRLDHAWTPVQCENCHLGAQDHPFSGTIPKVATQTCLQCHTAERAPAWYLKDGKLNEVLVEKKKALISCPAMPAVDDSSTH